MLFAQLINMMCVFCEYLIIALLNTLNEMKLKKYECKNIQVVKAMTAGKQTC